MINYAKQIASARAEIKRNIVRVLRKHKCKEVDVTDFDSTPIIWEDLERCDYSYTLDRITVDENLGIRVEFSNCEDNGSLTLTSLSTDVLLDLYEWLIENEEDIFNEDID